jgi:predicted DNA-binding antitoxin AbrB/MazE fold protein
MLEIKAIYENGVLKPDQPLPLEEHQHVRLIIQVKTSSQERQLGMLKGSVLYMAPDFDAIPDGFEAYVE